MKKLKEILITNLAVIMIIFSSCDNSEPIDDNKENTIDTPTALRCFPQSEQTDYTIYKLCSDGTRIGDVMPYYDELSQKFYIYYLKDVWVNSQKHPWYKLSTDDFSSFLDNGTEVLSSNVDNCAQDNAIGSGSVIKKDGIYYSFYTGHNPNYPGACT